MVSIQQTVVYQILILIEISLGQTNNVCKTFADYYKNMQKNDNCYYNPDVNLTIPEIVQRHGYSLKQHNVTTKDGYILTVFRILNGKNSSDTNRGPPVFLQHGIAHNGGGFLLRGSKSLGFILADAGYDVWLGNLRGSFYSRGHKHLSGTSKQFWDFSFNEMGVYDLPAQLDLVWEATRRQITYIGYSMGTTSAYIYGVTYPDEAFLKVKVFISLAPVAYMKEIDSIVKNIIPLWKYVEPAIDLIATNGRIPLSENSLLNELCSPLPFQMQLCEFLPNILFGFNYEQDDPETLPVTQKKLRDDTSLKTITHYIQLIESGKFQYYDYGFAKNLIKYGSSVPPKYELSKIQVPVFLMRADNDLMATKENVEKLYANLPARVKKQPIYTVAYEKFAHTGFLLAKDVVKLLYKDVLHFVDSLN